MPNFSTYFREMDEDNDGEVTCKQLEKFLQKEGYPTENVKVRLETKTKGNNLLKYKKE